MSLESADANLDVGTTSSCIRTMPERSDDRSGRPTRPGRSGWGSVKAISDRS